MLNKVIKDTRNSALIVLGLMAFSVATAVVGHTLHVEYYHTPADVELDNVTFDYEHIRASNDSLCSKYSPKVCRELPDIPDSERLKRMLCCLRKVKQ